MNLSGISNRSAIGKLLRFPLGLMPKGVTVPILQGKLKGAKWTVGASTHGCWLGSYEFDKQCLFAEHAKSGHVVYDIGANVGFYTLLASRLVGQRGHVYAFEPVPRNLSHLRRHLLLNRSDNVTVYDCAVGKQTGTTNFDAGGLHSTGRIALSGALAVSVVALDETPDLLPPDIIKMDIEGGERDALLGAQRTLRENRPVIFLATHTDELSTWCTNFLRGLDYRVEPVGARADEWLAI